MASVVAIVGWTIFILIMLMILASVINTVNKSRERFQGRNKCAACGRRLRWNRAAGEFYRTCFRCGATQVIPPKAPREVPWIVEGFRWLNGSQIRCPNCGKNPKERFGRCVHCNAVVVPKEEDEGV